MTVTAPAFSSKKSNQAMQRYLPSYQGLIAYAGMGLLQLLPKQLAVEQKGLLPPLTFKGASSLSLTSASIGLVLLQPSIHGLSQHSRA